MLIFDHYKILEWAFTRLRYKTQHEPISLNLLPEKFTLLELQRLYESILRMSFDKPNFRRKIMKAGLLFDCNEKQVLGAHRAVSLFKFDPSRYR
jgi:8-oxo-dGTP diphosphatase